ncbi:MAG: hypothetical protein NUW00_00445, partial [Candidatus Kaiserbacteria bacterium]|nr:hypothetical protein [Candidatus Kaiserbacteria bacterium]
FKFTPSTAQTSNSQTANWKTFATTTVGLIDYSETTDTKTQVSFSFQYPPSWSVCKKVSGDTEYVTVSDNCSSNGGKTFAFPTNYFEVRNIGALDDNLQASDTEWKIVNSDSTNGAEPMRSISYSSENIDLVLVGSDSDTQSTLDKIASTFKFNP